MMTMTAIGQVDRIRKPLKRSAGYRKRQLCTENFWIILFLISIVILLIVGPQVIYHKSNCQSNPENTADLHGTTVFLKSENHCIATPDHKSLLNKTTEYASRIWSKNWIFDALTFNVASLNKHYQESGTIVIFTHIFISLCLIGYFITTMRTDDMYCNLLQIYVFIFLACTGFTRLLLGQPKQLSFEIGLSLPEVTLIFIMSIKSSFIQRLLKRHITEDIDEMLTVMDFSMHPAFFLYIVLALSLILIIPSIDDYQLNWNNQLSYVFIAISFYVGLTIYYYVSMVMSCGTTLSHTDEGFELDNCFNAWSIIARYHFGTACYQATLIFPRIHSTIIMNKKEFKKKGPKSSFIDRFYLTHWKVHDLSLMMTGARGYNHSISVRKLLRYFSSESPKLINFEIRNQMFKACSALLLAIDSLVIISLYVNGTSVDPNTIMERWITNLVGMLPAYFITKLLDAASDSLWIQYVEKDVRSKL